MLKTTIAAAARSHCFHGRAQGPPVLQHLRATPPAAAPGRARTCRTGVFRRSSGRRRSGGLARGKALRRDLRVVPQCGSARRAAERTNLRSPLVLGDQNGELIVPVIRGSRAEKGMPAFAMPDEDANAIAEYLHSQAALSPRQGMPPPSEKPIVLDILVGDATAGRTYFEAKCSKCHSPAGDLQGLAARVSDPKALQNFWVSGGSVGGRGGRGAAAAAPNAPNPRAVTVTVTLLPSGEKVEGRLIRIDDFFVSLTTPTARSAVSPARARVRGRGARSAHAAPRAVVGLYRQGHARRHGIPRDPEIVRQPCAATETVSSSPPS